MYAGPVQVDEPETDSDFAEVWRLFGCADNGRFLSVALRCNDFTRKFAVLGIKVANTAAAARHYLCCA
jgi:hypothetical protein